MADDLEELNLQARNALHTALVASQDEADHFRALAAELAERLQKKTLHARFLLTLLIGGVLAAVLWCGTSW
jgi:hypothetical protein